MKSEIKTGRKVLLVVSGMILLVALLCSCGGLSPAAHETQEPEVTTEPPRPVASANGKSDSVLCKESYTADSPADASGKVATAGDMFLTNAQLQPYYYMAVADYMAAGHEDAPDPSIPLDCQLCPLGDGTLSWQHYFLQEALNAWHTAMVLSKEAEEPIPITEAGYETIESYHNDNIKPELPAYELIYGDKPCYKPNTLHQEYLDQVPQLLGDLAKAEGYSSLADFADQVFGQSPDELVQAVKDYNFAYMFFTEKRYHMTPSEEELTAAIAEMAPGADRYISIRHLLRIPEGASVAADGTVTAAEADWAACQKETGNLVLDWSRSWLTNRHSDSSFSRFANAESADKGTSVVGGLYYNVKQGQLMDVLDQWVFDAQRKEGDYEIFQTPYGIQVIYISAIHNDTEIAAAEQLVTQKSQALLDECKEKAPLSVDYSSIALWTKTENVKGLSFRDVLYHDVAHQRFPEAIVYLQQDYPHARYGGGWVARGGCGVTTMAMLATYMTDTVYTPGYLANIYGYYRTPDGTNGDMFRYVPAELGFQFEYSTSSYDQIYKELENNKRVISLQILGHFTRAGHYLLLERVNDDGTVVVRDSNIFNYKRLSGHMIDCFTKADIMSGNSIFYVMQEKVTRTPACSRCGDPEHTEMPTGMLRSDYLCEKCQTALARRNDFLTLSVA